MDAKYEVRKAGIADQMRGLKSGVHASVSQAIAAEDEKWSDKSPLMDADDAEAFLLSECKRYITVADRYRGHVRELYTTMAHEFLICAIRARETDAVLERIAEKYGPY